MKSVAHQQQAVQRNDFGYGSFILIIFPLLTKWFCPFMRFVPVIAALLLVSACTNLPELKKVNPTADDFPSALAAEYLAYAESEQEQGRSSRADYYAGKGLKAAKGEEVLPDSLDSDVKEPAASQLVNARKDLLALLTEEIKKESPQELARLQLLFDCWQQQAMRGDAAGHTACADEFKPEIIELQDVAQRLLFSKVKNYRLSFRYNSDKLTPEATRTFNRAVRDMASLGDFVVVVQAGSAGGSKQHVLQERRRRIVQDMLLRAGIPDKRMREYNEGASKRVHLSKDKPVAANEKQVVIVVKMPRVKK